MNSKILDADLQVQPFEKMREAGDTELGKLSAQTAAKVASMGSLAACLEMVEQLNIYVKEMRTFVGERERLGEYDASASAIIELSKVTLRLMEFELVALRAIINFRLEN